MSFIQQLRLPIANLCEYVYLKLSPLLFQYPLLFSPIFLSYGLMCAFSSFIFLKLKSPRSQKSLEQRHQVPEIIAKLPEDGTHFFFKTPKTNISLHLVSGSPLSISKDGPLLLFVHGFPECWFSWRAQLDYFSKDYKCIAMNMRGYGESDAPPAQSQYHINHLISDVDDVIDAYGNGKCILIGHDWGGLIAYAYAALQPNKVSKLIILNAPHPTAFGKIYVEHFKQFLNSWYIYFFKFPYLPEMFYRYKDFLILDLYYSSLKISKMSENEIDVYKYYFSKPGTLTAAINYYRANFPSILSNDYPVITSPALLLWGCKDLALVEDSASEKYLKPHIEQIKVVKNYSATHFLQQDDPNFVNEEIEKFIS